MIGTNRVWMDPTKVEFMTTWPTLRSPYNIRMFLGLANFYQQFIKNFSQLAAPLTKLLKKENMVEKFNWNIEAQATFEQLKIAFIIVLILIHFDLE